MSPVGPRRTAGHERPLRATRNRPLRGRREKVGIDGRVSCSLRSRRFRVPLQAVFVSAERSCPKGGGQAARGGRPAVQTGAPRRTPIAARRSTATAAFVVARKRTMRTRRPLSQVLDRRSLGEGGCGCVARRARQKSVVKDRNPEGLGSRPLRGFAPLGEANTPSGASAETCRKIEHPCLPVRQHVPSIIVGKRRGAFGNYERPEPPK